mgnify:CR=1 FL=1
MKNKKKPDFITLTNDDAEAFKKRVRHSSLSEQDQSIVLSLLTFSFWIQTQLMRAKLTILRLKKIFGLPTEKKKPKKDTPEVDSNTIKETPAASLGSADNEQPLDAASAILPPKQKRNPQFDPDQNHGRYPAKDYSGCEQIFIPHESLKAGGPCPECAPALLNGKLYEVLASPVIKLKGNPIVTGTCYLIQNLRCTLCGDTFTAELPEAIANGPKYNKSALSAIAIGRYYSGQPFKRIELLQKLQGIPLADATQWDEMVKLYDIVLPVYLSLEINAAQGRLISYDDTGNHILSAHGAKKTIHTTAFISTVGTHLIYLFYTSQRYAGENMELLMADRTTDGPLITMTDASSQNFPKKINEGLLARWVLCFCLVHGRRKFYEIVDHFKEECDVVIDTIAKIYKNEKHCKINKLTPDERLKYHQEHSAPAMEALRIWLNNQLLHHLVEHNSTLGEAVRYMLRHWAALTRFLSVAGAPIDNSLCEQAIKVAIRHRRNSLFYKTVKGAQVGDCLMSIIHTAAKNNANIFHYLNTLQEHKKAVHDNPDLWLPWNYQSTLNNNVERTKTKAA